MSIPPDLSVITKTSLRDSVLVALRDAIISGEMRPGELYTAPSLAKRLGVSSTPVREAMVNLAEEQLIISVPYKGFQVTKVSQEDLRSIAEIRLLLEPPTARSVTPHIPESDFPTLRSLAEEIVRHAKAGQLSSFIEADRAFHLAILEYSGNARLVQIISKLRLQTRLLGLKPLHDHGKLVETAQEHEKMVDLIEARDAEGLERLLHSHIKHVLDVWSVPDLEN